MSKRTTRVALVALFVCSLAFLNPYVRGDGNGYYAWLVSPVIDHDLNFENQYRHADPLFQTLIFDRDGHRRTEATTPNGHTVNQWSVGPALLWLPWFLLAHGGVLVARAFGAHVAADGYSWPYLFACGIGTVVYGWLSVWLSYGAAVAFGYARGASVAALAMWAASPLPLYQYVLPFHVHAIAAFAVAWFIWWWARHRSMAEWHVWACWGATAGVMILVYQIHAVLLLIAVYEIAVLYRRAGWRTAVRAAALFTATASAVYLPQLIGKAVVYGTPFTTGYGDQFFWTTPRLWQTAWSAEHGLFTWTPVVLIATIGLFMAARKRPPLAVAAAACLVFFYAIASFQNWHGQSSFGNRFFVSLTVFFVIGAAMLAERLAAARPSAKVVAAGVIIALVLWNGGLAFQWGTNMIPTRGPVNFVVVARQQMQVPVLAARFAARYYRARATTIREIEQRDADERRTYDLKR